ncbi:hypothetical protein [Diaphorobacter aerolatus]|uniref:Uncharacterized protein n=1 Tax=Diaphorobacter aerolatus TaxID=1288495 RepID=A0A7H0GJE9_9BURK|nr:hypothetical protein [Diaphorobacter aerolatus]QNP48415.1 hypothetical protein H9K75_21070 [Diaphorobacter aerolatus]
MIDKLPEQLQEIYDLVFYKLKENHPESYDVLESYKNEPMHLVSFTTLHSCVSNIVNKNNDTKESELYKTFVTKISNKDQVAAIFHYFVPHIFTSFCVESLKSERKQEADKVSALGLEIQNCAKDSLINKYGFNFSSDDNSEPENTPEENPMEKGYYIFAEKLIENNPGELDYFRPLIEDFKPVFLDYIELATGVLKDSNTVYADYAKVVNSANNFAIKSEAHAQLLVDIMSPMSNTVLYNFKDEGKLRRFKMFTHQIDNLAARTLQSMKDNPDVEYKPVEEYNNLQKIIDAVKPLMDEVKAEPAPEQKVTRNPSPAGSPFASFTEVLNEQIKTMPPQKKGLFGLFGGKK